MQQLPIDLSGRRAVVTGANTGLGFQTAGALAGAGASVILAVRSVERGDAAAAKIRADVPDADLRVSELDLADLVSVRKFAADEAARGPLHLLVNNAGVMLVPSRQYTVDGFEQHMGTNHLGHVALTAGLLPALLAADRPRIVAVSSIAHRFAGRLDRSLGQDGKYTPMGAYGQSKLANLLFVAELHRRYAATGLVAAAAHPGWSATELFPKSDDAAWSVRFSRKATAMLGTSAQTGARPQLFAATARGLIGNEFIGPRFWLWGPPRAGGRSKAAEDAVSAGWLWDTSVELTGADFG